MFNLHLLQTKLTVEEYETVIARMDWFNPVPYFNHFPSYTIARCPFCSIENVERLNTYSIQLWDKLRQGKGAFDSRAVIHHCQHFALVQVFVNFHGIWPSEARGMLGPEVPHIIGHLLENGGCLAVIHALPICRIEERAFVPRYTLFMVSYFSEQPEEAYRALVRFNVPYVEPGVIELFIPPPAGCDHWWNLRQWVSTGQLYWIDGNDLALSIRTHDINAFPYENITGRIVPYSHTFPYSILTSRKTKRR